MAPEEPITDDPLLTLTDRLRNHGMSDVAELVEAAAAATALAAMHDTVLDNPLQHMILHHQYDLAMGDVG